MSSGILLTVFITRYPAGWAGTNRMFGTIFARKLHPIIYIVIQFFHDLCVSTFLGHHATTIRAVFTHRNDAETRDDAKVGGIHNENLQRVTELMKYIPQDNSCQE